MRNTLQVQNNFWLRESIKFNKEISTQMKQSYVIKELCN